MDDASRARDERGHLMAAVVAIMAIAGIFAGVAMQQWADVVQRDNEAEMMFRAERIVRAIVRYRQARPEQPLTDLEMLMEEGPRGEYFMRKLWKDPLVADGVWGLLYQGPGGQIVDPSSAAQGAEFEVGNQGDLPAAGGIGTGEGQLGGLPIIGVKTKCTEHPFRVYKGLSDYGQWLFTIYDLQGEQQQQNQTNPQQPNTPRPPGQ